MTTITIPRETWDAVLEVLEQSPSIEHSLPNREVCTCSQCDFFRLRKAALSAAKAVSEDKRCELCRYDHGHAIGCESNPVDIALAAKATQTQAQGEASCGTCGNTYLTVRTDVHKDKREFMYCDCCGAMADRKTWNRAHPQASEPKAQGNEGVIEERMALADLCDAMGSPNIAEYLRAQAEISRKEPTT